MDWFHDAINDNRWNAVFTGNRTHLKIKGLDRVRNVAPRHSPDESNYFLFLGRPQLPGVTSLDISIDGDVENGEIDFFVYTILSHRLLNLQSVSICNDKGGCFCMLLELMYQDRCPSLTRIMANKTNHILINGGNVQYVSELIANDCQFVAADLNQINNPRHEEFPHMLHHCSQLERLSIKNASWAYNSYNTRRPRTRQPMTQDMLVKMVRNLSTLRWLKSDLSKENVVAMLKGERPEVTFVSE